MARAVAGHDSQLLGALIQIPGKNTVDAFDDGAAMIARWLSALPV
jgi:hypothetical protein